MNGSVLGMMLLAAGVCSCSTATNPEDQTGAPFTTDATTYTAKRVSGTAPNVRVYGFTAVTRYTNRTATPIQLPTCSTQSAGPLYGFTNLDDPLPTGWIVYGIGAFVCLAGEQWIVVAPGATRVDTLHLEGTALVNVETGTVSPWVVEGQFRIFFQAMSCPSPDTCSPAPDEQRRSSPFTVRAN
jgi:hypothetical protein